MIIAFELSMPGVNSWNGKWSGESDTFAIVKNVGTAKETIAKYQELCGYHTYNFGDGWCAGVDVREVSPAEARKLRKHSRGFCGYDWMVESLIYYGTIMNDLQRKEYLKTQKTLPLASGF